MYFKPLNIRMHIIRVIFHTLINFLKKEKEVIYISPLLRSAACKDIVSPSQ